ncbi:MAG: 50S ribosomal protein L11 methyltransferase, partial [Thermodesulfobacteriota bacterium]
GLSFVEPAIGRPVRVSRHIILKPPKVRVLSQPEDLIISLVPGAAFGLGEHPTTRLALRGIEHAAGIHGAAGEGDGSMVLDIGTGTGVLVIAAVMMGIRQGIGTDPDPCSRSEARENVKENGLGERIEITEASLNEIHGSFEVISANLRYPTLISLCEDIRRRTTPRGVVVVSGLRSWEAPILINRYRKAGFVVRWEESEHHWHAVVFQNNA